MADTVIILAVVSILTVVTWNSVFSFLLSSYCEISFLMMTSLQTLVQLLGCIKR
jgi:hypothetical protein